VSKATFEMKNYESMQKVISEVSLTDTMAKDPKHFGVFKKIWANSLTREKSQVLKREAEALDDLRERILSKTPLMKKADSQVRTDVNLVRLRKQEDALKKLSNLKALPQVVLKERTSLKSDRLRPNISEG